MTAQHVFQVSQFDPESPDFDLLIDPSLELDIAIRQSARQVAGFI
jgi:hypothetical protein